jgi:uncharacterized membrane protein (DUF4010 family)
MSSTLLFDEFIGFALAVAIGFLIGMERAIASDRRTDAGVRDYVLFALLGAISAFLGQALGSLWFLGLGFLGLIALLVAFYWRSSEEKGADPGITSELAAILTFLFGVLAVKDYHTLAIALAVVTAVTLAEKQRLSTLREQVQRFELDATLKLLVISFIVLPVLPRKSLDQYLTLPLGEVAETDDAEQRVVITLLPGRRHQRGEALRIYGGESGEDLGIVRIDEADPFRVVGTYDGPFFDRLASGQKLRAELGIPFLSVMASAIEPYKVWWIVVLVSSIGFVGYVLVKVLGGRAGIALTGLVGGMASSTATTLSFSRRSVESPQGNHQFAVAILLASTIMFPRLLVQIAVVDQALMRRMTVPLLVMAGTGVLLALRHMLFGQAARSDQPQQLGLDNPFSLKSAMNFGLIFAIVLVVTRLAITYLGDNWLPAVTLLSGLTDADAVSFSVSSAHLGGLITLDWAAFNAVLGAIANTLMKVILVALLGTRGLLKYVLVDLLVLCAAGLGTAFFYYQFSPGS